MEGERRALNPASISIAPTTAVIQRPHYDLPGGIEPMRLLWLEAVVDGFELQNMASGIVKSLQGTSDKDVS